MHIYGRIYAAISVSIFITFLTFVIVFITISTLDDINIFVLLYETVCSGDFKTAVMLIWYVIAFVAGIYMYYRVYKLSPDFMKKRCLIDLTVSGVGTLARVVFWFVRLFVQTWWMVAMPDMYMLDNGLAVYIFPNGKVYDSNNNRFGVVTDDKTAVIWEKRN